MLSVSLSEFITADEFAERVGLNVEYVRRALRLGKFPGQKAGWVWLVRRDFVEEYLAAVRGKSKNNPTR